MRDILNQIRRKKNAGLTWSRLIFLSLLFWALAFPVLDDKNGALAAGQKVEQILKPDSEQEEYNYLTGVDIITKVFRRHKTFPYVYEEQTMILTDNSGNKDVRKARRYSRVESDNTMKYLLVFDYPIELKGLTLRFIRDQVGMVENQIYIPALGKQFSLSNNDPQASHLLGTDFALEDLVESLSDFQYVRGPDQTISKVAHFVVEAFPQYKTENQTVYSMRRLFIRQDIFFIVRTDYFDQNHRLVKQLTRHDLKKVDKLMWRANMLLMENKDQTHTTLIKINRRVFSKDYVRPEIFTPSWLQESNKVQGIQDQTTDNNVKTENNIEN